MKTSLIAQATIIIFVGPAGAGKSTVYDEVLKRRPSFVRLKTVTTRPMRDEKDRLAYIPVTLDEFARLEFIEKEQVHNSDWYGTPKKETLEAIAAGGVFLLCIDIRGFQKVREYFRESETVSVFGIFIDVPDDNWENRLRATMLARPDAHPEKIEQRIATARSELNRKSACDVVIPNHIGKLDETVDKVIRFIENLSADH